jgi:uncharacterized protein (UPF0218 family)
MMDSAVKRAGKPKISVTTTTISLQKNLGTRSSARTKRELDRQPRIQFQMKATVKNPAGVVVHEALMRVQGQSLGMSGWGNAVYCRQSQ